MAHADHRDAFGAAPGEHDNDGAGAEATDGLEAVAFCRRDQSRQKELSVQRCEVQAVFGDVGEAFGSSQTMIILNCICDKMAGV